MTFVRSVFLYIKYKERNNDGRKERKNFFGKRRREGTKVREVCYKDEQRQKKKRECDNRKKITDRESEIDN